MMTAPAIPLATPAAEKKQPSRSRARAPERFLSGAHELPDLSAEYTLASVGTLKVSTQLVSGTRVTDPNGHRVPVYLSPQAREDEGFYAFVDAQHPVLREYGSDYADFVLFEVANNLKVRAGTAQPLGELVAALKERFLRDSRVDPQLLSGQAKSVLQEVCERMSESSCRRYKAPPSGTTSVTTSATRSKR